jgi:ribosomal protein S3AE
VWFVVNAPDRFEAGTVSVTLTNRDAFAVVVGVAEAVCRAALEW